MGIKQKITKGGKTETYEYGFGSGTSFVAPTTSASGKLSHLSRGTVLRHSVQPGLGVDIGEKLIKDRGFLGAVEDKIMAAWHREIDRLKDSKRKAAYLDGLEGVDMKRRGGVTELVFSLSGFDAIATEMGWAPPRTKGTAWDGMGTWDGMVHDMRTYLLGSDSKTKTSLPRTKRIRRGRGYQKKVYAGHKYKLIPFEITESFSQIEADIISQIDDSENASARAAEVVGAMKSLWVGESLPHAVTEGLTDPYKVDIGNVVHVGTSLSQAAQDKVRYDRTGPFKIKPEPKRVSLTIYPWETTQLAVTEKTFSAFKTKSENFSTTNKDDKESLDSLLYMRQQKLVDSRIYSETRDESLGERRLSPTQARRKANAELGIESQGVTWEDLGNLTTKGYKNLREWHRRPRQAPYAHAIRQNTIRPTGNITGKKKEISSRFTAIRTITDDIDQRHRMAWFTTGIPPLHAITNIMSEVADIITAELSKRLSNYAGPL